MNPWFLAIRPKTLPASIAPVVVGTAMAFGDGIFHAPSALVALLAALSIQIGTNLANDYFDFKKEAKFKYPFAVVAYVYEHKIPVHFYYNFTDTPAKNEKEIMAYLVSENSYVGDLTK